MKARPLGQIEFIVTEGNCLFVEVGPRRPVVGRTILSPEQPSVLLVDVYAKRITQPHDIDFGTRFRSTRWKQVPLGDFISALLGGTYAEDFATEGVTVGRGLTGVEVFRTYLVVAHREI